MSSLISQGMNKSKIALIIVVSLLVGFGIGLTLSFKKYSVSSVIPAVPQDDIIITPSVQKDQKNENKVAEIPRMLTYENLKLGFQFHYPESYFISNSEDSSVALDEIASRDKYGDPGYPRTLSVSIMEKGNAFNLFRAFKDAQQKQQQHREEECRKKLAIVPQDYYDDFEQCAYYGGGFIYSTTTFTGIDAVQRIFEGEGGDPKTILYLPSKGLEITYNHEDPQTSVILQSFVFIDTDRVVYDDFSGVSFYCFAYWTCHHYGKTTESDILTPVSNYILHGKDKKYTQVYLAKATVQQIDEMMQYKRKQEDDDKKELFENLPKCLEKGTEEDCQNAIIGGRFWPYADYTMEIQGVTANVIEFRTGDRDEVSIYIPQKGWVMRLGRGNFLFNQDFIKKLFD